MSPKVTCPSAAKVVLPSRRTARTVVERGGGGTSETAPSRAALAPDPPVVEELWEENDSRDQAPQACAGNTFRSAARPGGPRNGCGCQRRPAMDFGSIATGSPPEGASRRPAVLAASARNPARTGSRRLPGRLASGPRLRRPPGLCAPGLRPGRARRWRPPRRPSRGVAAARPPLRGSLAAPGWPEPAPFRT